MRRRVVWHPSRGIDKSIPKVIKDVCENAYDADDISVYNESTFCTRRSLKLSNSTDYTSVYGIHKYQRGLATAGTHGIYLDGTSIYSTTYSSYVWMASWYNTLFVSDGIYWKKITSDNHAYTIGIDAPTWEGDSEFVMYFTTFEIGGASWTQATCTLVSGYPGLFASVNVGDAVQLSHPNLTDVWALGRVSTVSDSSTIVITIDEDCEIPPDNASITYWISPNRLCSKSEYDLTGTAPTQYYKVRFKRSGDGTRSNTASHYKTGTTTLLGGSPRLSPISMTTVCVGGFHILGLPTTSTDSDVDYIELLKLDTGVSTSDLYRVIATLPLGTATYDDSIEITQSLTALEDDLKYPCPSVLKGLLVYGSRLWGHVANKVYYSEAYQTTSQFEYFGAAGLNFFDFPDTVQAIADYGRTLIVFLERETWVLEGLNPSAMNQRRLNEDVGTYGNLSVVRYGGSVYTVSSDMRLWQISGPAWQELRQGTSVLPSEPSYVQLIGSDGSLWVSTGSQVARFSLTNLDLWVYGLNGYMASGSHTAYIGQSGHVYEIDSTGGTETFPASYIESPDLFIGTDVGLRGKFNRVLFRANCASGTITIYVDGSVWKTIPFSTEGEQTVVKHFWPVQGYYVKIRISSDVSMTLNGPIILNPW